MALVARSAEGRGSAGGECGPSCNGNPLPSHHSGLLVDSLQLETQCFSCEFLVELPVSHLGEKKKYSRLLHTAGGSNGNSASIRQCKTCQNLPQRTFVHTQTPHFHEFLSFLFLHCDVFSIWAEAQGSVDAVTPSIPNKCSMPKHKSCHWGSQNLMSEAQQELGTSKWPSFHKIWVLFSSMFHLFCHGCVTHQ